MYLWGVAVLELDSHPDHNKGPEPHTYAPRSWILAILNADNQPFNARTLSGSPHFTWYLSCAYYGLRHSSLLLPLMLRI